MYILHAALREPQGPPFERRGGRMTAFADFRVEPENDTIAKPMDDGSLLRDEGLLFWLTDAPSNKKS